jgi:hypothetical protein
MKWALMMKTGHLHVVMTKVKVRENGARNCCMEWQCSADEFLEFLNDLGI